MLGTNHLETRNGDGFPAVLSLSWIGNQPATEREAMTIALSKGVNRNPRLGFLVNVERSVEPAPYPIFLEASTDLVTWTTLATNNVPAANAIWPVTDTTGGLEQRFYRTLWAGRFLGGH